ncbi:hypothetical protein QE152_g9045 [Popillia japonica]|uniref:Uncharacterized protein n=1 Tax=Popillia japonica TaxID=7064 RepID=A0AAW1M019_POPJA
MPTNSRNNEFLIAQLLNSAHDALFTLPHRRPTPETSYTPVASLKASRSPPFSRDRLVVSKREEVAVVKRQASFHPPSLELRFSILRAAVCIPCWLAILAHNLRCDVML